MNAPSTAAERRVPDFRNRLYRAEWRAAEDHPVEPLDGTLTAAQAYVDRITRSAWWRRTCPPSWMGDERHAGYLLDNTSPPRRIICQEGRGGGAWAAYETVIKYRGRYHPYIRLGNKARGAHLGEHASHHPPIRDQWVILHEVAHIMCAAEKADRGHGRAFARYYLALVRRWLGPDAARALREAYAAEGVKYRAR